MVVVQLMAARFFGDPNDDRCSLVRFARKVTMVDPVLGPCLLYTSPSPRDATLSRMPSSA